MEKVQVFDSHKEMWAQIGKDIHDSNLEARMTLGDLYEKALSEYKGSSDFSERWLKKQEEALRKGLIRSIIPPKMIHLSNDEQKEFEQQCNDLGKDLELTAIVKLHAIGRDYQFLDANNGDLPFSFSGEYDNLASLVGNLKSILPKLVDGHYGTKLTPTFYTTTEDQPIMPEHITNDVDGYMKGIEQEIEDFLPEDLPEDNKNDILNFLKNFASSKDRIRGLTTEECQEFERLFYQQE